MNMRRPSGDTAHEPSAIVEIVGPWLQNKGDALMLAAVRDRVGRHATLASSTSFGLPDLSAHPDVRRIRWGVEYRREFAEAARARCLSTGLRAARNGLAMALLPVGTLSARGVVPGRALTAVLDCSGFAYGDQWTTPRLEARRVHYARLRRQGASVIMLPQALGPFERPDMRAAASALFAEFDLMFARDDTSRRHLESLGVDPARIRTAPDITHLVKGKPPKDADAWRKRACIVPNTRMLDKGDPGTAGRHLDFLAFCIRRIEEGGLEPWLVLHEAFDRPLVSEIEARVGRPLPVLDEDAVTTKGVLGAAHLALSSRFHAIVSCLSQGTPVIGTSWSHKYEELFSEYGCPHHLITPQQDEDAIAARLDGLIRPAGRNEAHGRLSEIAVRKSALVDAMWAEIAPMMAGRPRR